MKAPIRLDPNGFIPLQPFTRPLGIGLPVYTAFQTWEDIVRHDPLGAMTSLRDAVGRALVSDRADYATISFKHWVPPQGEQRKSKRVRLDATIYQMTESDQPWILVKPAPARYPRGVSAA